MENKKYLGKRKKEYNKSFTIGKLERNVNYIFNSKNNSKNNSNKKRDNLQRIFKNESFQNFVKDVKNRVQKLNREYAIQQVNYSKNEIPEEISTLANALNDYTNDLVGFYEKSYFNISNNNQRKQFIRDLKLIIGTYGELEENLQNIVYNNNKLPKRKGNRNNGNENRNRNGNNENGNRNNISEITMNNFEN